jgi:hypothetical protein
MSEETIGPFEIQPYQLGFHGNPNSNPQEWDIILNIGCLYEATGRTSTFTFLTDRDGAKRLAALALSPALSLSIDEADVLATLAEVRKRLGDLLPDYASWVKE